MISIKDNFYRAMGMPEWEFYYSHGVILSGREWVNHDLEKNKYGFSFNELLRIVDSGGWVEGVNNGVSVPRDFIVKVEGICGSEFAVSKIPWIPSRYENTVRISIQRAIVVYDPRASLLPSPLFLSDELIPELESFRRSH